MRRKWLEYVAIPGMLLTLTSGCATTMPPPPTKPQLATTAHPEDKQGRCLDGRNIGKLLIYVREIERYAQRCSAK